MTEVIFVRTTTGAEKLSTIGRLTQKHYEAGDRILVATPSDDVAQYVDKLLWREPKEGFIPHHTTHTPCHYDVAVTASADNVNDASVLINLTEETHPLAGQVELIYELFDTTTPAKEATATKKMNAYQNDGFSLTTL